MASIINLTPQQPITLAFSATALSTSMPIFQAIDISGYDLLDLQLGAAASGSMTGCTIGIATGMTMDSDDNWMNLTGSVTNLNFSAVSVGTSASLAYQTKSFGPTLTTAANPLLRYLRWSVNVTASGAGSVTFTIRGIARRIGAG